MTNPFSAEPQNPFLTPYPGSGGSAQPGTAPSPFLGAGSKNHPRANDPPIANPLLAAPVLESADLGPAVAPSPRTFEFPPVAHSANARKSQILSISEMGNINKPEFFLTTTATVDGYTIKDYLGLVSIEIVVPKDLLFRNPAPHGDLHRLKSAEDELQRVKVIALEELSQRARSLGADGIVGLTLQFSQFDAIVCLCSAVGTAVKLSE